MAEKQVYGLQLLTFLVNKYDYQIVNIKGLPTQDYWLINLKQPYPLICITQDLYTRENVNDGLFGQVYHAILSTFTQSAKCLILNTNAASKSFEYQQVTQIPIVENMPVDSSLLQIFEGIDHVVKKVDNVTLEKRHLTRVLQQKARDQYYAAMKGKGTPKVTITIGIICVILFLLVQFMNIVTNDAITSSILLGSYYKMNVISAYEYWRLLSAGFVHIDLWHLMVNMISLMNIGPVMERRLKKKEYLLVLLVSIAVGNLFVLIGDGNIVAVGLSGGLFGFLGVYTVFLFADGAFRNPRVLNSFISTIMINVFISLMPNVSMLAHLGGFISGLALGVWFSKSAKLASLKQHVLLAFCAVLVACCIRIPFVTRIMPVYAGTDARIIKSAQKLNLDFYANYLLERYDTQMENQGEKGYKNFLIEIMEEGSTKK